MRKIFLILSIFICSLSFALDISADVENRSPEAQELFDVVFRVSVNNDVRPKIDFKETNLQLIDVSDEGISSSVTYINGNMTKKTEYIFRYTFKSQNVGNAKLSQIRVTQGNEQAVTSDITFNIGKASTEMSKEIFVRAEPSKKDVFKGEAILLKYFLYYKRDISNYNILEFPKLKGFMKRFFKERDYKEIVTLGGERYSRIHLYSSVVFPEKKGNIDIDSMVVEVTYPSGRARNNIFGGFGNLGRLGLGFGSQKKKRVASQVISLNVKPLPAEGRPSSFTGLVGENDFKIKFGKSKLIVNEPLEVSFEVVGDGNLEAYDGPEIFSDRDFEEFERNSDLKITKTTKATKKYNYTFIARRENLENLDGLELSVFNPKTEKYEVKRLPFPRFKVIRTADSKMRNMDVVKRKEAVKVSQKVVSPYFDYQESFFKLTNVLNFFLALFVLWQFFQLFVESIGFSYFEIFRNSELSEIKKNYLKYGEVYKFLTGGGKFDSHSSKSITGHLESMKISNSAKQYFRQVLSTLSSNEYDTKQNKTVKFKAKYFKEVIKFNNGK